ncbi:Signal peptidase complex subunit 1 [Echinococcus granulosus]|uniref:Signal peptidase complex subunit 1 n=1 Tax=Echinococcus granulosus TaxID=6210 RepID=U6J066_ECHGR|nr:Signal peptidase complex subunit [Echinococcus granulosus]EUB63645.1 Signal peptidase complex subunit [Echinococcus granulosus]KAH9286960.1 Signal peptidase complex subunit 1 [Echinococcus granulosus]CDS15788.1 signal peptidase complex subunit 1 [Echinococcus granulosus]
METLKAELFNMYEECSMDFEGQKLAERIMNIILPFCCVVGFILGYIMEQLSISVGMVLAGLMVCMAMVLPPWPMYRKHPLKWQKPDKAHNE